MDQSLKQASYRFESVRHLARQRRQTKTEISEHQETLERPRDAQAQRSLGRFGFKKILSKTLQDTAGVINRYFFLGIQSTDHRYFNVFTMMTMNN